MSSKDLMNPYERARELVAKQRDIEEAKISAKREKIAMEKRVNEPLPSYMQNRVEAAVTDSVIKETRKKRTELSNLKLQKYASYAKSGFHKVEKGFGKVLPSKLKNRQIMKGKQQVTVVENQPVYSKDKSRFFKTAWEVEKRQLFFD